MRRTASGRFNACLQPYSPDYLEKLEQGLEELGVRAPLFVMQSNSGTVLSRQAIFEPARLIESGPVLGRWPPSSIPVDPRTSFLLMWRDQSKAGVWSGLGFEGPTNMRLVAVCMERAVEGSGYLSDFRS